MHPIQILWRRLQSGTRHNIEYLGAKQVRSRFDGVACAKNTAITAPSGCFLHANTLGEGLSDSRWIASQYPFADKQQGGGADFWMTLYDHSDVIIDLTGETEELTPYYPLPLESLSFDDVMVSGQIPEANPADAINQSPQQRLSYYEVHCNPHPPKQIARYHFSKWADFSAISLEGLLQLLADINAVSSHSQRPLWVHCRAGVGRSGTLITAMLIQEHILAGRIDQHRFPEQLMKLIWALRAQRNGLFVQTLEQFLLLYRLTETLLEQNA